MHRVAWSALPNTPAPIEPSGLYRFCRRPTGRPMVCVPLAQKSRMTRLSPSSPRGWLQWCPLTSADPFQHLTMLIAQGESADLPRYCALTFTLMPVGSTSWCSVQVSGLTSISLLISPRRLYPLPVRQASALLTASFRSHLAMSTVAAQLTLPLAGWVEDFHLRVGAPCRAHKKKPRPYGRGLLIAR